MGTLLSAVIWVSILALAPQHVVFGLIMEAMAVFPACWFCLR